MATSTIEKVTNVYGSNSYGNYCKMPDGMLMQWGSLTLNSSSEMTLIGSSGIYQTPSFSKTLPVNFVGDYEVTGMSRYSSGHFVPLGAIMGNGSQFTAIAYDFVKRPLNDGLYVVHWQAIGRWK